MFEYAIIHNIIFGGIIMDYQERIEQLNGFIKKCEGFNENITGIGFWNLNDGINDPECIDRSGSNWKVFENNVNTYFKLCNNEERKKQFQKIVGRFDIDESVISDLIILFNQMKNDIQIEMKNDSFNNKKEGGAKEKIESANNKIFVVHGRDEGIRDKVELLLRRARLDPIILAEQVSCGMTIIEKIEANSDVAFAVVLYTGCDEGKLKEESVLRPRARQNVVFEHGYMVAKLGRDKVVALTELGIEQPGDLAGVVYIPLNEKNWERRMLKELEAGGLQIDWSKI